MRKVRWLHPCLVCGVDSTEIRIFLVVVMGGLVFGAVFVSLWAWGTGRFKDTENLSRFAIDAEAQHPPKEK